MSDPDATQTPDHETADHQSAEHQTPGYEDAREELIEVVRTLEAGGTTLEESLALWERGERLARVCQEWLDGARRKLDAALEDDEGDDEGDGGVSA